MLTPEDDIVIKQETSCSKEEAVAKLLGWMRGVRRRRYIKYTPGFISEDQLPYLCSLPGSVQELLKALRDDAYLGYYNAAIIDPSIDACDIAEEKREAVERYDGLIDLAASYLRDIESELERGEASALRIDRNATGSTGAIHLTLSSLDRWSHQKYGFSIFEPPSLPPETEAPAAGATAGKQTEPTVTNKPWWIVDESDPPAAQAWYTPARYFARQLVSEKPSLRLNRDLLASDVLKSFNRVGIKKRGDKEPFQADTLKKAFVKVLL